MMVALARGIPSLLISSRPSLFKSSTPRELTSWRSILPTLDAWSLICQQRCYSYLFGKWAHTSEELDGHIGGRCDTGSVHGG